MLKGPNLFWSYFENKNLIAIDRHIPVTVHWVLLNSDNMFINYYNYKQLKNYINFYTVKLKRLFFLIERPMSGSLKCEWLWVAPGWGQDNPPIRTINVMHLTYQQ